VYELNNTFTVLGWATIFCCPMYSGSNALRQVTQERHNLHSPADERGNEKKAVVESFPVYF